MIEKEVSILSKGIQLSGTLCLPSKKGNFPTILWLQGSGPIDRNDNIPGQELNNSKLIAHHLADNGIASLRFDKRGVGKSTGNYLSAGHSDLVDDGLSCLRFLAENDNCDTHSLFVVGHSEGAIIAPQLSQRFKPLAGIVLICPFVENFESLLMRQASELKAMANQSSWLKRPLLKAYLTIFDPVKGNRKVIRKIKLSKDKVGRLGLSKQPLHWFREMLNLNLEEIYRNTICPVLAIAGSKDIQCLPDDVEKIGQLVAGEYEAHTVKDMSHLLRSESKAASLLNYSSQLEESIEPKMLELVRPWIEKQSKILC
jgi:pimeloyl-ACP methyl ester carboxylesterase